jgi:hypothetical protein
MSGLALLLAAAAVGYVSYPLLRRCPEGESTATPVEPREVEVGGVLYESEAEWALERLLGRACAGTPTATARTSRTDLEGQIEAWVASVRDERRRARAGRRVLCQACGKPFRPGDHYCARCGQPHPAICVHCGVRYRPGDRFCTQCGAAVPGGRER